MKSTLSDDYKANYVTSLHTQACEQKYAQHKTAFIYSNIKCNCEVKNEKEPYFYNFLA